jgi:hypothetical protein
MTMKLSQIALAGALVTASLAASAKPIICVWDIAGKSGDTSSMALDYVVAMQKQGVDMELKTYVDERVAVEDFRSGQCAGVIATSFRVKPFNAVSTSMDSLGSATIVRNGKIDVPGSYEVVRKVIQLFSGPKGGKLMVEGNYEVGGILPIGAAYPIVRDRAINSVEALAGKRIAAFDYDKSQAAMISKIGATPVSVDLTSIGPRFNNGGVDMITLPAIAYKPMELYKGIGTKGAIGRFPIMIPTIQMILKHDKFPEGFGEKSRQFWLSQFDRAMGLVNNAEKGIPVATWLDLPPENIPKYVLMLRESRIEISKQGMYNKQTLNIMKRVRCSINSADSECTTVNELD